MAVQWSAILCLLIIELVVEHWSFGRLNDMKKSLGSILYILLCNEWNFRNGVLFRNFKKEFQLYVNAYRLLILYSV